MCVYGCVFERDCVFVGREGGAVFLCQRLWPVTKTTYTLGVFMCECM